MRRNSPGLYVAIEGFQQGRVSEVQSAVADALLQKGFGVVTRTAHHTVAYQQVIWDILLGERPMPDLVDFHRLFVLDAFFLNVLEFVPVVVDEGKALVTAHSPFATFAYGALHGLDTFRLWSEVAGPFMMESSATPFVLWPDVTVFLDVPSEEMQLAMPEQCPPELRICFNAVKVRDAFLAMARKSAPILQPVLVVDASAARATDAVVADVLVALDHELFPPPAVP